MSVKRAPLKLVSSRETKPAQNIPAVKLSTLDLFCGAGGITEGFRDAGYRCLYGNDCMKEAVETFSHNHPDARTSNW